MTFFQRPGAMCEVVLADSDARMAMTAISWHNRQPEVAEASPWLSHKGAAGVVPGSFFGSFWGKM